MNSIKQAVSLTSVFVSLPPTTYLLSVMLLIGPLVGIIYLGAQGLSKENVLKGGLEGLFLISIPALLTALIIKTMLRSESFRRIVGLALVGEILYSTAYLYYLFIGSFFPEKEVFIFGAGAIAFIIVFLVARILFSLKWRAFLFAGAQTLIYSIFLITGSLINLGGDPYIIILKFFVASGIFLLFLNLFFFLVNAPMKKSFNLSTIDAVSLFLAHWFYESKDIEEEFEKIGDEVNTLVGGFLFKRKKDIIGIIVPYVHFGPFGELGGSNFPYLIEQKLKRKGVKAVVLHSTATHDLNPASSTELEKITEVVEKNLKEGRWKSEKGYFSKARWKNAKAQALVIGKDGIVGLSRAPHTTEDIHFGMGLALMSEFEKKLGLNKGIVVDQHNSETGKITSFEAGSDESIEYLKAIENLKKAPSTDIKVGYAQLKKQHHPEIAPAGIKVLTISTKPLYLMIVVDSNGITPKLKEQIESKIKEKFGNVEIGVFTTDSHLLNKVRGVVNPLSDEEIVDEILLLCEKALENMERSKIKGFKEWIKIKVLGYKQSIEIISTINAIMAIAKISAPLILLGAILSILLILSKI